jgi:hypothetical protein
VVFQRLTTYRKSGRLLILRVMGMFHRLTPAIVLSELPMTRSDAVNEPRNATIIEEYLGACAGLRPRELIRVKCVSLCRSKGVYRLLHNLPQLLRKFSEERICTETSRLFS